MMGIIAAFCLLWTTSAHAVDPGMAGTLSIVPGLGQIANGNPFEGLGWFVSSIGLMASNGKYARDIGFKIWEYNMYDAYRDAGAPDSAKYSVFENYIAFLNPVNLVDPFSVGIVGLGALSATSSTDKRAHLGPPSRVQGAFFYGFVGLGEEGLFRGFIYPEFPILFSS